MRSLLACVVALLLVPAAWGEWVLTDVDFDTKPVEPLRFDGQSLTLAGGQAVPAGRLLEIRRDDVSPQTQYRTNVLYLSGGDRLVGKPAGFEGERLAFDSTSLGLVLVPLERLLALQPVAEAALGRVSPALPDRDGQDVLRLSNGDVIRGIVGDLSGEGVTISVDGQPSMVPLNAVASLVFADLGMPADQQQGWAVLLQDGTRLTLPEVRLDGPRVSLAGGVLTQQVEQPLRALLAVEQVGGPVVWASSLTPAEALYVPYLAGSFKHRMNSSVTGEPIVADGKAFSRGIGVHARSRLSFDVPEGARRFRTQYAMAGELPLADVTVRVLVDGQVKAETQNVKAGTLYDVISVDVTNAGRLTLEVDYGEGLDVQDRLNWIEPAFVR
ncbi:MAG: NPCBM/NEW2 domain-containing protein [Phycisphaerae bacterium]